MENIIDPVFYEIAQKVAQKGGRLYIVGGAVRDLKLGKKPHDIDYCVTGISESELAEVTRVSRVQGSSFPVCIVHGCEVALARSERKVGTGHKGFEISTDKSITIEQDLQRRDLTINSMAIDVLSGELIDPYGGAQDLENKVLRHTSLAFAEDPLRVYRVARFASKFGFEISEDTIELMKNMRDELSSISRERVFAEFRKALVEEHPELFFEALKKDGILDVHFKELADLIGVEQPIEYHPEGDAFSHTMEVLQRVVILTPNAKENEDEALTRFCALVHDFGKGTTPREEWPHHYAHEERGIQVIHAFCKRIKAPKLYERAGKLVSSVHMKAGRIASLRAGSKVKMFEQIYNSRSISFRGVEIIARADSKEEISFTNEAEEVMKVRATQDLIEKCTESGVLNYEKLKMLVMQERVALLKQKSRSKINLEGIKEGADLTNKTKDKQE